MKLWKNVQPTFTELRTTLDEVTLDAPWQLASAEELAQYLDDNRPLKPGVPYEVSRRNFFRAVHQSFGLTRTQLRAMMVAAGADEPALIDFDEARDFKRSYPLLIQMAAFMTPPVTSEQLDDLFRLADTYE
jgi:hypothetical protein